MRDLMIELDAEAQQDGLPIVPDISTAIDPTGSLTIVQPYGMNGHLRRSPRIRPMHHHQGRPWSRKRFGKGGSR